MRALKIKVRLAVALGMVCVYVLIGSLNGLFPRPATIYAANYHVCNSGCPFSSIQAAIDAANAGDIIKVATGTYTDLHKVAAPAGYTGSEAVVQIIYVDKNITIQGGYPPDFSGPPNPFAYPTILDSQGNGRVAFVAGSVAPVIDGFVMQGGNAANQGGGLSGKTVPDAGGGVYIFSSPVTFSNNRIVNNNAEDGGGVYLWQSTATLAKNTLSGNVAEYGGAIFVETSSARLDGNTVQGNAASFEGGGLFLRQSDAILTGNTITANKAESYGGGLSLWNSPARLENNTISHNVSQYIGGGLALDMSKATLINNTVFTNTSDFRCGGLSLANSAHTVEGNLIIGNTAESGGGVCLSFSSGSFSRNTIIDNQATLTAGGVYLEVANHNPIDNNIIANNWAGLFGSGLYIASSSSELRHTTIADNKGGDGSGIYVADWLKFPSEVKLINTIIAGQTVGVLALVGNVVELRRTLWGAGRWVNDQLTLGAGIILTDPTDQYGDPAFMNAAGGNYRISVNSPAVDAGIEAGTSVDIDGQPRPMGQGVDIGADEIDGLINAPGPIEPTDFIYLPFISANG